MNGVEIGTLFCETDTMLEDTDAHLLRGYVAHQFPDHDLIHNHDLSGGRNRYRYPLIQFKIVHGMGVVVAVGRDAIALLQKIEPNMQRFTLRDRAIEVRSRSLKIASYPMGDAQEMRDYMFVTPWIGLNSENYRKYCQASTQEQEQILRQALIGNLLSLAKGLNYTVQRHLRVSHCLEATEVNLKGQQMLGFLGTFCVNFYIPDFLGIGKSPSRGYGCCMQTVSCL